MDNINTRHRNAQFAGRASSELFMTQYFSGKTQHADGRVVRVRRNAVVVFLPKYGVEGVVYLGEKGSKEVRVVEGCVFGIDGFCRSMWACEEGCRVVRLSVVAWTGCRGVTGCRDMNEHCICRFACRCCWMCCAAAFCCPPPSCNGVSCRFTDCSGR